MTTPPDVYRTGRLRTRRRWPNAMDLGLLALLFATAVVNMFPLYGGDFTITVLP